MKTAMILLLITGASLFVGCRGPVGRHYDRTDRRYDRVDDRYDRRDDRWDRRY